MNPELWDSMSEEAQKAYSERNDRLWELIWAINPGSGGCIDEQFPKAVEAAARLRSLLKRAADGLRTAGLELRLRKFHIASLPALLAEIEKEVP